MLSLYSSLDASEVELASASDASLARHAVQGKRRWRTTFSMHGNSLKAGSGGRARRKCGVKSSIGNIYLAPALGKTSVPATKEPFSIGE